MLFQSFVDCVLGDLVHLRPLGYNALAHSDNVAVMQIKAVHFGIPYRMRYLQTFYGASGFLYFWCCPLSKNRRQGHGRRPPWGYWL